jgi:hypothetical protein|tara:strand:+ start:227 stop:505 length:279 start_codon:yes stop_codon:yes gene_type:complete
MITRAKEIAHQQTLRPRQVQDYYGIKTSTIYQWYKKSVLEQKPAPILISNPGKTAGQVFIDHQSIIDYFNSGLWKKEFNSSQAMYQARNDEK